MSNQYIYIGNKTFKGPLGMDKPSQYGIDNYDAGCIGSCCIEVKLWREHIDSLPYIPYIGKEDDFKPDQICEEGKEIRVGYQMKLNTDWIDATMWVYGHTSDTSKRTVILPNTPVVSQSKEKDNVPSYSEEEVKEIIRYCAEKGYYTWASSGNIFEACNDDISTTPSEILLSWKKQKEESK